MKRCAIIQSLTTSLCKMKYIGDHQLQYNVLPGLYFWSVAVISRCRRTVNMKTISTFSCTQYFSLKLKRGRNCHVYLGKVHPRGGSHLPLRCCFWVPAHANNSMVSMNCVTTKVTFRIAVPRSAQQLHRFICPNHL
jgi:hypothetical protein